MEPHRRRPRRQYPLPLRGEGLNALDMLRSKRFCRIFRKYYLLWQRSFFGFDYEQIWMYAAMQLHIIHRRVDLHNPVTPRREVRSIDFSDSDFVSMRLHRDQVDLLLRALQFPDKIICDNGTICHPEMALLMLMYRISYPTRLITMVAVFGRTYDQISRIIKAVFIHIYSLWDHVIDIRNLAYFKPRFSNYNRCFINKYHALHGDGVDVMDWWRDIAMIIDGTKIEINRHGQVNYSGHKRMYCVSFLIAQMLDGMVLVYGAKTGRYSDHQIQNACGFNAMLEEVQINDARKFKVGADKGFHFETYIHPMHHARPNTALHDEQNRLFSPLRVTVEHAIGNMTLNFKFIDFSKGLTLGKSPIGIYYRVICLLSNALTILNGNQTSLFFDCAPPSTLEEYFVPRVG